MPPGAIIQTEGTRCRKVAIHVRDARQRLVTTVRDLGPISLARFSTSTFAALICIVGAMSCAPLSELELAPLPGAIYVAMGSSFAAGPTISEPADTPTNRCSRSADNYARQLARKRDLKLIDVSCGGATTALALNGWNELPPQTSALSRDTALVTITIGGNDVGYFGSLFEASCRALQTSGMTAPPRCDEANAAQASGSTGPSENEWKKVEAGLQELARQVRLRSPRARLIFVDYITVMPNDELCPLTPLTAEAASTARKVAARLAKLTAQVARESGSELLRISELSRPHHACAPDPWITGFQPPLGSEQFIPYHPNLAGMTAVANELDAMLD